MKIALGIYCLFLAYLLPAQQTIGLFNSEPSAFPGYTLFGTMIGTDVYLIDNCGEVVNKWDLVARPGLMTYLTTEGNLLRTERLASTFGAGGTGGRLSLYDWDSELIWRYDLSADTYHHHHDIAVLPNGNILAIVWESITREEAANLGRKLELIDDDLFWLEKIVELKPIGNDQAEEVWTWRLYDHLIQDQDASLPNFGEVKNHPEKVDINFNGGGSFPLGNNLDWIHLNSIDYNPTLDQIVVSSRHLSEFWIIDHSTTTAEAATDSGGDTGKGGSLLYRWGNPRAYDRGEPEDQTSYLQHDATWVKIGAEQAWGIATYNNGTGRPGPDFSQIDFIKLPINANKSYDLNADSTYDPLQANMVIDEIEGETFFNNNVSGAQILPNGNALICVGGSGSFYEVDTTNSELHWKYLVPLEQDTPLAQGAPANGGNTFKIRRYPIDFPGFDGKDLTPIGPIELDPLPKLPNCIPSPISEINAPIYNWTITPNPAQDKILLSAGQVGWQSFEIYNALGNLMYTAQINQIKNIDLSDFSPGVYFITGPEHQTEKFIIQRP